ncbi:MAG TPA: flagellar motor stator protein MotA [Alphaproteobacteria bacterium]|jgi:chemotaxis protein MotA|nr:flagellar motor stator protein MotA [Alphaproteobacteria bacterium]
MLFIIGALVVIASVIGGYIGGGGHLFVLWQPFEILIIVGAGIGGFVIANPKPVLIRSVQIFGDLLRGPKYTKENYLEVLSLLYSVFKLARTKGMLTLESHVEHPEESTLFAQFPGVMSNHHAMTFLCDYLRLLTLGTDNALEMETLMDEEIETHHHEAKQVSDAWQTMSDGLPALGIVAAVLGVIHTMGLITEPPAVLGHAIGGALVGTFMGVLLSYGFVGPISRALSAIYDSETKYFQCIKAGILAYLQGYAPAVAVEFARKALLSNVRPTFYEVEEATQALPAPQA